jgi:hypothetical protein
MKWVADGKGSISADMRGRDASGFRNSLAGFGDLRESASGLYAADSRVTAINQPPRAINIAGCIMAACAMRIELPMLSWVDMPPVTGISMVEDAPGIDIIVISNADMPMPAPNRMYIQESARIVA